MGEMPDGWCAAPFRFAPENEHGDPDPIVFDEQRVTVTDELRALLAIERLIWSMDLARRACVFPMTIEAS
jgi:hypothetical protein